MQEKFVKILILKIAYIKSVFKNINMASTIFKITEFKFIKNFKP